MSQQPDNAGQTKEQIDSALRLQYLGAMGIQVWQSRFAVSPDQQTQVDSTAPLPVEPSVEGGVTQTQVSSSIPAQSLHKSASVIAESIPVEQMDWQQLQNSVAHCQLCELHETRTQTVFGTGNQSTKILFIGEAPGEEEDQQGEPFVGVAGQLLNKMLLAVGLQRSDIYITNMLKCRPPENRDPRSSEILCCESYLNRQIELINPDLIVALGRVAAQNLLVTKDNVAKMRTKTWHYKNHPLRVLYHPAYLLRMPTAKREAWHDLLAIKQMLSL